MITSITNNRMKRVKQLQEKAKMRDKENVFVVEGIKMFQEAPMKQMKEIYITQEFLDKIKDDKEENKEVFNKIQQFSYEIVSEDVFKKISDTQTPQGILCVVEQTSYRVDDVIKDAVSLQKNKNKPPLFLLLEDIQDPGNLGTMIRTAEGAGVDAIFMSNETVSIYNPKTIRSTMGSIYRVPLLYVGCLRDIMEQLKQNRIHVYAAHLKGKLYYYEVDYSGGSAFLIGNEGSGLKKETAVCADTIIRIPMKGKVESLNAAIAASLLMYKAAECARH